MRDTFFKQLINDGYVLRESQRAGSLVMRVNCCFYHMQQLHAILTIQALLGGGVTQYHITYAHTHILLSQSHTIHATTHITINTHTHTHTHMYTHTGTHT